MSRARVFIATWFACLVLAPPLRGQVREMAELQPVQETWQYYPETVSDVKFDKRGRPWFQVAWTANPDPFGGSVLPIDALKRHVEQAAKLERPWIFSATIRLVDRHSRVWLVPHKSRNQLLRYSWVTGKWFERTAVMTDSKTYPGWRAAFDAANGCVYFADGAGVHVLTGER